jgi:hypothetical protein
VEDGGRSRSGRAEDTIEHEGVEMNVGVQGRTEPAGRPARSCAGPRRPSAP